MYTVSVVTDVCEYPNNSVPRCTQLSFLSGVCDIRIIRYRDVPTPLLFYPSVSSNLNYFVLIKRKNNFITQATRIINDIIESFTARNIIYL